MLLKKLIRTAKLYRAQFISMIIMLSLGIGVFLGFNMEWHSIESNTSKFFDSTDYADFRIYSEKGFSKEVFSKIEKTDGVDAATRYLSVNVGIKNSEKTVTLNVSENFTVSTFIVTLGEEYDETSLGIWLSDRFAEENNISVGESITFTYNGKEIEGSVAGLCKSSENMICTPDSNQLMPDYTTHGFAYVSPKKLKTALGYEIYPQVNIISDLEKPELEERIKNAVGTTLQITDKELHTAYAGAKSEAEEGKTMGLILPVLFLAIAVLTMVTTMHRIAANEKVQIGTLKALGFKNRKILLHYTSYGFLIGLLGAAAGVFVGIGIAKLIISPTGMMSTYFDLPTWSLTVPPFCIPCIIISVVFISLISLFSTRKMLSGTAAEALRPYSPKITGKKKKSRASAKLPFSLKWNFRDIIRHKSRSLMTLFGVLGCTVLILGGLGMKDTMREFLDGIDKTNNYTYKLTVSETAQNKDVLALSNKLDGQWQSTTAISYGGKTVSLDIFGGEKGKIRFLDRKNNLLDINSDGVYLCLRLESTANIGDKIEFSPYGSDKTYTATVAGYYRSLVNENIVMTSEYAEKLGIDYRIGTVYTNNQNHNLNTPLISGQQEQKFVMNSYDTFLQLMNLMVGLLVVAAIILGTVVLYNLGIMSYVERRRELATLKVLGFRDKKIGNLLIGQNMYLTAFGVILGLPAGVGVLDYLIKALCTEYELKLEVSVFSLLISVLLTFGVSLVVGLLISRKNKKIDMVEALKSSE